MLELEVLELEVLELEVLDRKIIVTCPMQLLNPKMIAIYEGGRICQ